VRDCSWIFQPASGFKNARPDNLECSSDRTEDKVDSVQSPNMPAPLDVNREAVRVLVLSVGVRVAARQMGIPQATVQAWSARGKWLRQTRDQPATMPKPLSMVSATIATKPHFSLQNTIQEEGDRTRVALLRSSRKAAEHVDAMQPRDILNNAKSLYYVATVAEKAAGWGENGTGGTAVNILSNNTLIIDGM
jgi:hypothetical protein